jgi:hypothetical protein
MRELLIKFERWVFEDESALMGLGKFILSIFAAIFIVVFVAVSIVSVVNPHERVVLDLTTTWDCTSTHTELQRVMHGKISRLEDVVVCDNYRMRSR